MKENKKNRPTFSFYALGGLGEVGKNMYCFEYNEQIFIVDAGIMFPDEHLLGIDYVIPNLEHLINNQDKIVGLFITHGHEDHIGGIPYLLRQVKIPKIYACGIAVDLIESKLEDVTLANPIQIVEFKAHFKYNFKGVELSFVRLNHSIPDSFAFVFKTELGSIVHTGDFKIDFTPVGPAAEYDKLAKLGSEGVLALLADSTNALVEGFTISESKVGGSLKELFSRIEQRAIVATFASNIYRVQQIIEACISTNRHLAVFGRSMEKTIEVGQQAGYIKCPKGTIIDTTDINNYPPEQICLLCTGSQGEPLAALSRIASGTHRQIKLIPGDTIIFSSSPIPGNQDGVNKTINLLFKHGANVITHSPLTDTHTSGHASQGELKMLQSLLKPKYFIPVHGEYRMQKVHADIAIECGVKPENTFILQNGDVLTFDENGAKLNGKVPSGEVYIDGNGIGDISSAIINERKRLSEDGLFSVIITIDMEKKIIPLEPQVVSRGFIYMKDSELLTKYFVDYCKGYIMSEFKRNKNVSVHSLRIGLIEKLGTLIHEKTDREPIVIPIFMEV